MNKDKLTDKQRTTLQNKALHKYFDLLARAFNDAGLDMRVVLKEDIAIPWSGLTVKDFLWKPVQRAQLKKEHTADLTTKEPDAVWQTLNRHIGEKWGIYAPFPSIEEMRVEEIIKHN